MQVTLAEVTAGSGPLCQFVDAFQFQIFVLCEPTNISCDLVSPHIGSQLFLSSSSAQRQRALIDNSHATNPKKTRWFKFAPLSPRVYFYPWFHPICLSRAMNANSSAEFCQGCENLNLSILTTRVRIINFERIIERWLFIFITLFTSDESEREILTKTSLSDLLRDILEND